MQYNVSMYNECESYIGTQIPFICPNRTIITKAILTKVPILYNNIILTNPHSLVHVINEYKLEILTTDGSSIQSVGKGK